jgi:hypothetical protein
MRRTLRFVKTGKRRAASAPALFWPPGDAGLIDRVICIGVGIVT